MKAAQVSGLKENVKVWERQECDFDDLFYNVFEYHGTSFICTIYIYICMYVFWYMQNGFTYWVLYSL